MKIIVLIACLITVNVCSGQGEIGAYGFVEVPDRFEFVSGDNTYQLSDMMVYYLEKKGVKAYRVIDSPNVAKCDALYADIQKEKSILSTKLLVVLKDCDGQVVYKSKAGTSKEKAHDKMYPDALRDAFKGFSLNDVKISEANTVSSASIKTSKPMESIEVIEVEKPVIKDIEVLKEVEEKVDAVNTTAVPQSAFTNYSLNGNSYLLKKVTTGFTLFLTKDGTDDFIKVGDLMMNQDGTFTMKDLYGEIKNGRFNDDQNIVIGLSNGEEVTYIKVR